MKAGPGCRAWCDDCYERHSVERRLAVLRRCKGMTTTEIREAYSHFWPPTPAGEKALARDRKRLREGL